MKWGGVLIKPGDPEIVWYAMCPMCCIVFQDNVASGVKVACPKCAIPVVRGLTKEKAREQLDEDLKEILA